LEHGEVRYEVDEIPVVRKLLTLSALQRLNMQKIMLPDSNECRLADAVRGLHGLQSLRLNGCVIGGGNNFASVVSAIAGLPELRDLRLASMPQWDDAASVALAAATQLTGLMLLSKHNSSEFASLMGQVHKLRGLRRLWADCAGMDRFDVAAAAASLTGLTELCLLDCDSLLLHTKFPAVALGCVWHGVSVWGCDPLSRGAWEVKWWSPAEGTWK
jgi:hypothetical protein